MRPARVILRSLAAHAALASKASYVIQPLTARTIVVSPNLPQLFAVQSVAKRNAWFCVAWLSPFCGCQARFASTSAPSAPAVGAPVDEEEEDDEEYEEEDEETDDQGACFSCVWPCHCFRRFGPISRWFVAGCRHV
jgi:hypothetical protein